MDPGRINIRALDDIKLREPKEETGWRRAPYSFDALRATAGDSVLEEQKDENGNVKSFIVDNIIDYPTPAE